MSASEDWASLVAELESELRSRPAEARPANLGAWADLRRHLRRMARLLAAPDDADDVVQTVLLKLQSPEALQRMRASRSPEGYATVMVRNAAIDAVRRRATAVAKDEPPVFEGADEALDTQAQRAAVVDMLDSLAASDRLLLRLRFWEDLSIADIARRLGMPYSTVAVRLFRLLRRLRSHMGADRDGFAE